MRLQTRVRGWIVRRHNGKAVRNARRRVAAATAAAGGQPERQLGVRAAAALQQLLAATGLAQVPPST